MYQRCPPSDLNEWEERYGCTGWGDASLRPYFKRSQLFTMRPERPTIDLSHHSLDGDGTWQVGYSWLSKPGEAFIDACDASGVPANPDVNDGKHPIGATRFQTFIDQKGQRSSAFTAYLPASVTSRSNLTIAINAHVTRILLEGAEPVATGAEFQLKRDGPRHRVYANKEVILCGGAYNSPQTMLLSGLGPAEELKKHNIPLVKDMPDVGKNLYDHVCTSGLYGRTSSSAHSLDYLTSDLKSLPALIRWLATGGGPMTTNVGEAAAFARMADFDSKVEDHGSLGFGPDIEFIHTPLCFRDHGATTTPAGHPGTISIAVIGLRPLSKGSVTLRSNSVFDKAVIRHNYWTEPNDRRVLIAGVRKGLEIFHNAAFDPYVDRSYVNDDEDSFYWPVSSSNYKAITDEQSESPLSPRTGCDANTSPQSSAGCTRTPSRSTTPSARCAWASTTRPCWTCSCACAASRTCVCAMPASCRSRLPATRRRRSSPSPRRRPTSSAARSPSTTTPRATPASATAHPWPSRRAFERHDSPASAL
jgi:choline dehydrogenase